ncbi:hypothetical protein SAMN04488025_103113 [Planifilum fulgidum]|jgi:uncharacterized protein YbdZ (MbtH family)|uniref:Uncharacterized protein n=1 Tax=Planifilum fulgidum TaxID=201973 RepID=A0A1I2KYH7_9BACL|nr:hypothetical protein [Planifilum fulgidum]MBO2496961.1 hypothetical protein [Bacillota bacterium]MBO2531646.1 hypothetical protein [Thermoactinomycetaceae bacterium]SFF71408.1 hypothetical protein SAMN04488025_103113 [Planifilum fulgidum]
MEFSLMSKYGRYPCEVVADEDQFRFWVRKADTTGEFFQSQQELLEWIRKHWRREDFLRPEEFDHLLIALAEGETR